MTVAGNPLDRAGDGRARFTPRDGLVSAEARGRSCVLRLAGDLDLFSAEVLRRELEAALPAGPAVAVVDLREVSFLDSTVLGLLLLASRRMEAQGGALVLAAPGPAVERVLDVSGLRAYLPAYPTVDEALAHEEEA